jgi:hypothetical protein
MPFLVVDTLDGEGSVTSLLGEASVNGAFLALFAEYSIISKKEEKNVTTRCPYQRYLLILFHISSTSHLPRNWIRALYNMRCCMLQGGTTSAAPFCQLPETILRNIPHH